MTGGGQLRAVGIVLAVTGTGCLVDYRQGGTTTGAPITCSPPCGANATCIAAGDLPVCECVGNYSVCPDGDGGDGCVEELRDNSNCGGCGSVCPTLTLCIGGACNCDTSQPEVEVCIDGGFAECADTSSDPLNCGTCGLVCPEGEVCVVGICVCKQSPTVVQCAGDGGELVCVDTTRSPFDGGNPCGFPPCNGFCPVDAGPGEETCCGGGCTDLSQDPFNCGACGNICISGSCILGDAGTWICNCPYPYQSCGSNCIDPFSDFDHCGGCTACSLPATECVLGKCQ